MGRTHHTARIQYQALHVESTTQNTKERHPCAMIPPIKTNPAMICPTKFTQISFVRAHIFAVSSAEGAHVELLAMVRSAPTVIFSLRRHGLTLCTALGSISGGLHSSVEAHTIDGSVTPPSQPQAFQAGLVQRDGV